MAVARIERYTPACKAEWDAFVDASKNSTFLLRRDYMDYHSDRFADHSLVFRDEAGAIVTLLPAAEAEEGRVLSSHPGLTYGGFVMGDRCAAPDPLEWFRLLRTYAVEAGFKAVDYKPVPHIYHRRPAEEDLYALFREGAQLRVRNLATAVDLPGGIASRLGKRAAKRSTRFGIEVAETEGTEEFWSIIEEDRRVRHNTRPVHTFEEIERLRSLFPGNIRTYKAVRQGRVLAGAVVFVNRTEGPGSVLHLQYAAANAEGMAVYAVDAIYHALVTDIFPRAAWFDFGTSNEDSGRYLNTGMTAHKEEFGGRSIVYDTYRLTL